ncbi:hypothetical protein [Streptomyces sp. NPDC005486]|uniref:hypothetical protein n=1 Tax=Streptomyces sp. NPDC005486 TaxID=3155345 RepID=UPI0033B2DD38
MRKLQEVARRYDDRKTILHPELGRVDVNCRILFTENRAQSLVVPITRPARGATADSNCSPSSGTSGSPADVLDRGESRLGSAEVGDVGVLDAFGWRLSLTTFHTVWNRYPAVTHHPRNPPASAGGGCQTSSTNRSPSGARETQGSMAPCARSVAVSRRSR